MFDDAKSVWELIERRAAASPDRVMLCAGDREMTFGAYRDAVEVAAADLSPKRNFLHYNPIRYEVARHAERLEQLQLSRTCNVDCGRSGGGG